MATQALLRQKGVEDAAVSGYVRAGDKLIDQVARRLIQGEQIPHYEKPFSVHEPHTRWISKGKSGQGWWPRWVYRCACWGISNSFCALMCSTEAATRT